MIRPLLGIGIIIKRKNKILLLKRKGSHGIDQWSLPGGYLEFGETFKQCAVREVKEETGLEVKEKDLHFISLSEQMDYIKTDNKHCVTVGFVVCNQGKKEPEIKESEKCEEIGWFDLQKLPSPLFIPSKDNIENYKKNILFKDS
ncbi:NUDIX hydrolase [Patescibacteria group bacterium]